MRNRMIMLLLLALVLLLSACATDVTQPTENDPTVPGPTQPQYEFTVMKETFFHPSMVHPSVEREVYHTSATYGNMYVFSDYKQEAERFVGLQLTLLDQLLSCGILVPDLSYIGTDYNGSFSVNHRSQVYISLNDMGTWQQILATLQGFWGDYTDYGYLYAISNILAEDLGWISDDYPKATDSQLNTFLRNNPYVLDLHYPSFTERYATEETVICCKTLSQMLLQELDLQYMLSQPIEIQLQRYRGLIGDYARLIGLDYQRQDMGFSFYAEDVPLRIQTACAEMFVEENYLEPYQEVYGSYFSTDRLIYQTTTELTSEMADAVNYMQMEGQVESFNLYWMSQESGAEKYGETNFRIKNNWTLNSAYTGTIYFAMHAYYRHLEHIITGTTSSKWQSTAFAEFGNFRHKYARMQNDYICTEKIQFAELFKQYMGREYEIGDEDCLIFQDILAFINGSKVGDAPTSVSCARYLMLELGEATVMKLLLNPKQVEAVAGRNWTSIEKEWKQHLEDFFASQTQ